MATLVGPPPGLSPRREEDLVEATEAATRNSVKKDRNALTYDRPFMLALSNSPLVRPPRSMPALNEWYGDWEPYHPRFQHHAQHSPMGSFVKVDKYRQEGGGRMTGYNGGMGGGDDGDGYVMRDGGVSGGRRAERFRKGGAAPEAERSGEGMRSADGRRFPASGKNPFGQVSSTGAFKPAGREGLDGQGRFGRMGRDRDRDMPPHSPLDDRMRQRQGVGGGAGGRDFGVLRDKRRTPGPEEEEDDWENVPRSPEAERRNRHAADAAADWRRGTGAAGKVGGRMAKEREGSRRTAFPSWMADDAEPTWTGSGGEDRSRGREDFFDEHNDINVDDVDVSGMDGIQAFKVRMREKERRLRERDGVLESHGPPPGLERDTSNEDALSHGERSHAALFDNFASSAKQRAQAKQQEVDAGEPSVDPPAFPGRTSRFARFFDGKPQATALAAQQKQMEAMMNTMGGDQSQPSPQAPHAVSTPVTPAKGGQNENSHSGSSVSMADLFRSMTVGRQQQQQQQDVPASPSPLPQPRVDAGGSPSQAQNQPPPALAPPPGLKRDPSEADVQGMQKIMALLSGGMGSGSGAASQNQHGEPGNQPRPPGPPPPPPGLNMGAFRNASPGPNAQATRPDNSAMGSPQHSRHNDGPPGPPPSGWHGQQPLYGPPVGFGIDPRMMAATRPAVAGGNAPSPGGIPGMPLHHVGGPNGGGPMQLHGAGFPPFPPGMRPPGPPPPLPPQLQQQLMGLPPQMQHQLLAQHFRSPPPPHLLHMHPGNRPPFSGPPGHGGGGNGEGDGADMNHLMALLGQGSKPQ